MSFDTWTVEKELEKNNHYQDLSMEVQKNCKNASIILFIIGALGSVRKHLKAWARKMGLSRRTDSLQKASLVGTAKILQRTPRHLLVATPLDHLPMGNCHFSRGKSVFRM